MEPPLLLALAPYSFEPATTISEARSIIHFFKHKFSDLYQEELSPSDGIVIFHDWWFAPYSRDQAANADMIFALAEYVLWRYQQDFILPVYMKQGSEYAKKSKHAFHRYKPEQSLFGESYELKRAAA